MKPEEKAEIMLWDWLRPKKDNNVEEIYFNRKNKTHSPIFHTKGLKKKPDFVIKFNKGFGSEYIALEIKPMKISKNIYDAGKILMYYENYIKKKTKYFIDKKEISIKHFAIATENSILGHLFDKDDDIIKNYNNQTDSWRKTNAKLNLIPHFEYVRTSQFQRSLWSTWRDLKKRCAWERISLPSIGIIISNPTKDKLPYLFTMWWTTKKQWGQRFWRL